MKTILNLSSMLDYASLLKRVISVVLFIFVCCFSTIGCSGVKYNPRDTAEKRVETLGKAGVNDNDMAKNLDKAFNTEGMKSIINDMYAWTEYAKGVDADDVTKGLVAFNTPDCVYCKGGVGISIDRLVDKIVSSDIANYNYSNKEDFYLFFHELRTRNPELFKDIFFYKGKNVIYSNLYSTENAGNAQVIIQVLLFDSFWKDRTRAYVESFDAGMQASVIHDFITYRIILANRDAYESGYKAKLEKFKSSYPEYYDKHGSLFTALPANSTLTNMGVYLIKWMS